MNRHRYQCLSMLVEGDLESVIDIPKVKKILCALEAIIKLKIK